MSETDRFSVKEAVVGVLVLAIVGAAMYYTLGIFSSEGANRSVEVSSLGSDEAQNVEAVVKVLAIDPIKGDLTARFEFAPSGTLVDTDGTLKEDLRVYINSSNGKQETDFVKGRRLAPVEGVFNLYEGNASEYPFDKYVAELDVYIVKAKPAPKKAPTPAPRSDEADSSETGEIKPQSTPQDEDEDNSGEIALSVDFEGSIPGYNIAAAKADYTDETYVGIHAKVERASTVKFFSTFVSVLMWVLTIGVLFLTVSVLVRGRKAELGMFSFMGSLLFAFYAVRNSQPNVPPIGVFSDFTAFFWVEAVVALCLLTCLLVWLFRGSK